MSKSRKQITERLIFLKFQENDDKFLLKHFASYEEKNIDSTITAQ